MATPNFSSPSASAPIPNQEFDFIIEAVATALNTYYTPILIILGCIGNILSIYVFIRSKLRMQSTSLYLSVLALSDTIFLLQLMGPWLNAMQITNLYHRRGFCQVFVYGTYTSCCLSAWLVVAFTMERFVAVLYPLRRNSMCTVARAKNVIYLLVTASIITNLPMLFYASPSVNDCNVASEYMANAARFNLADTIVSFSFPLGIIVVLNIRITCRMYARRALHAPPAAGSEPGGTRPPTPARVAPLRLLPPLRSQHHVTRMLLIVSTVFVVLNLPAYTMRLLAYAYDMSSGEYSGRWAALQQLALMFWNTNFGINFILYCLTGQNFRRELCQSIPCLRHRLRRTNDMRLACRNAGRASSITASYASGVEASTPMSEDHAVSSRMRRHRSDPFIERWTFNNRRSLKPAQPIEVIEMQDLASPCD